MHSTYIHTYIHTHTYTYTQGVIEQRNREEEEAFCIPPSLRTTTASSSTTPFGTAPHMLGAQTERVFVTSAQMRALGGGEGGGRVVLIPPVTVGGKGQLLHLPKGEEEDTCHLPKGAPLSRAGEGGRGLRGWCVCGGGGSGPRKGLRRLRL